MSDNIEIKGNNQEQGSSDKVQKSYEANMKKLVAVVGGKENLFPTKKADNDTIGTLVTEMLKKKKADIATAVIEDLSKLLDSKVAMDKSLKEEAEKLKKFEEAKKKEFNEACVKVFNKIEDINELEKSYYGTLSQAAGNTDTTTNT